jgi:hypothetical protein
MKASLLGRSHDAQLAAFCCCSDGAPRWRQEVENFLRTAVLRRADHVVGLWSDEGDLVAVSGFNPLVIKGLPVNSPINLPGWDLLVLGVSLDHQGNGHGKGLLTETLKIMAQTDVTRTVVKARAHCENHASLHICTQAGIEPLPPPDGDYVRLIGGVPGTAVPDWL